MASGLKYFVGNWKMFGIPTSFKILNRINSNFVKNKINKENYKVIIAPPFTLLHDYSKRFKNKKILISAQNCFHKDNFGPHTGNISPYMIKKLGIKFVIIGHSENRASGENDNIIKEKVYLALKNNLNIIFCIGENIKDKRRKKTLIVLRKQLTKVLKRNYNFKKIIIAYEPVWSIGSGKIPTANSLIHITAFLKKFVKKQFKLSHLPKILYGGSVDKKNIASFKSISDLDGFLIGGASKSSKNFIDIIKNFYK